MITMSCDGCGVVVQEQDGWAGKLPLPSTPLTEEEKAAGKKREKFSIAHSQLCKACTGALGEFIQTLRK